MLFFLGFKFSRFAWWGFLGWPVCNEDFGGSDAIEREIEIETDNSTKGSPNHSR